MNQELDKGGEADARRLYRSSHRIARARVEKVACPYCGSVMVRKHAGTFQGKKDRKLRDKIVILTLEKRRFRCLACGKVYTEPDEVSGPRRRPTKR